jgi:hypothetical protein
MRAEERVDEDVRIAEAECDARLAEPGDDGGAVHVGVS